MSWISGDRTDLAAERILDAAAQLFVERGVATVGMAEVARRAGCSRATLYRYFDSRRALQLAFVHRGARRIGATVASEATGDGPHRVVSAIEIAVREVRADPTLIAWFRLGDVGLASEIAHSSAVIDALATAFLGSDEPLARWVVRVIVSLLTVPGKDEDDEHAMLEQFVAPLTQASLFQAPNTAR